MELTPRSEEFLTDDQSWLASRHGINNAVSATLKTADFTQATHYPKGFFKSGIPLTKNGDGTYSPWAATKTLDGILLTAVKAPTSTAVNVIGAALPHGRVVTAKLVGTKPDAAGWATNPSIQHV